MSKQIQWFPGHMKKGMRLISEQIKQVDIVIELCDARIPLSSRNPDLWKVLNNKPRILVLNKADLADARISSAWLQHYKEKGQIAFLSDAKRKTSFKEIEKAALELGSDILESAKVRGRTGRPLRLMLVGIPNCGKSTFINSMAGRKVNVTQNKPGVTRSVSWFRSASSRLEWLDTPGLLWPKIDTDRSKICLTAAGAIRTDILDHEDVAFRIFEYLFKFYGKELASFYHFEEEYEAYLNSQNEENMDLVSSELLYSMEAQNLLTPLQSCFEKAASQRSRRLPGNKVDTLRFAKGFLNEVKNAKIARMTFEWPPFLLK